MKTENEVNTSNFREPFHVQLGSKRCMDSLEAAADCVSHLLVLGLLSFDEGVVIRKKLAKRAISTAHYDNGNYEYKEE